MTIQDYIDQIPAERKDAFARLRQLCKTTLEPLGFQECINYKMIGYVVPKSSYPAGYHCDPDLPLPFLNLANQKGSINLYHMGIYANPDLLEWFMSQWSSHTIRKLDMGKSCIRFKYIDDIPYNLIRQLIGKMSVEQWIVLYEQTLKK